MHPHAVLSGPCNYYMLFIGKQRIWIEPILYTPYSWCCKLSDHSTITSHGSQLKFSNRQHNSCKTHTEQHGNHESLCCSLWALQYRYYYFGSNSLDWDIHKYVLTNSSMSLYIHVGIVQWNTLVKVTKVI